jgi:hypothetical protein
VSRAIFIRMCQLRADPCDAPRYKHRDYINTSLITNDHSSKKKNKSKQ